nr:hypothetical protein [Tanacetum cinerariifolium]
MDVQAPITMAPIPLSAPTLTSSTIATTTIVKQAPTPPTTDPSTLLQDLPNFGSLFGFEHQLKILEANFSKFMQTNQFAGAVSSIPGIVQRHMDQWMNEAVKIIKEQVKEQVKVQVSKILPRIEQTVNEQLEAEVLTRSSSSSKTSYAALVEAYESNKIILDTYGDTVTLKRRRDDDANKDEEPSAGSDRGSKRREKERSQREPMQTTHEIEEPSHPEFETYRDYNKTLLATHGSIQPWISELAKQTDSRSSFNELMDTPVDFSAFLMNWLKVDTLTPKLLAGPTYELMKGSCKSLVEFKFFLEEVYKATTDQLDWINFEGQQYPHNLLKPLPLIPNSQGRRVILFDHFINNNLEYLRGGSLLAMSTLDVESSLSLNSRLSSDIITSTWIGLRMFTRSIVIQRRVEDLQLGVESYQKKLNLTRPDTYRSNIKRKEAYIAYSNLRGFIYQNKDKHNWLMQIDELHKFSDGTLTDVRTALDDRLKGIRMKYIPQTIWRKSDKERAAAMIQAIDKQLKTRRIMRSLEGFVGGRLYEGDFRMLQRTICIIICCPYLLKGYPLVSVKVLRYDKRSKSEHMGIVPTEMELILEHTQQGISHEVSISAKGVEE